VDTLEWANSSLVSGDVAAGVAELKQRPGKNIQITGSPTLVRSLLRDGLLDELSLLVHPIVVGGGKRLFDNGSYGAALELVDSRSLGSGVLSLTYGPVGGALQSHSRTRFGGTS
jgi:dihydrofolate reductase